ncbi:GSCOCG00013234001-RA-CDS [Cotesia congregata]|nr:GSCOCG00013234001-RA-CDS [Cotesia congregata]
MKVIIILSIATSVTLGSLEPAGYKPPLGSGSPSGYSTTGQSDRYLPPSLSSQLASHRSISNQGLTPESHYLPTSYQSPSQNSVPSSNYLASAVVSKQNQYHGRINQPSSTSAVAVPGSIGLSSPPPSSSFTSSSSSSSTSAGIISNSYLTPNKLSSSLLSQNNKYTGTSTAIGGQPERQSNILASGNINQPPGNYYSPDETFSGYDNNHKVSLNIVLVFYF